MKQTAGPCSNCHTSFSEVFYEHESGALCKGCHHTRIADTVPEIAFRDTRDRSILPGVGIIVVFLLLILFIIPIPAEVIESGPPTGAAVFRNDEANLSVMPAAEATPEKGSYTLYEFMTRGEMG